MNTYIKNPLNTVYILYHTNIIAYSLLLPPTISLSPLKQHTTSPASPTSLQKTFPEKAISRWSCKDQTIPHQSGCIDWPQHHYTDGFDNTKARQISQKPVRSIRQQIHYLNRHRKGIVHPKWQKTCWTSLLRKVRGDRSGLSNEGGSVDIMFSVIDSW